MKNEPVRSTVASKAQQKGPESDNNWLVNYEPLGRLTQFGGASFAWRGQAPIVDRFWACVNKTPTCWLWTGTILSHGYGQIGLGHPHTHGSKRWRAHRFSWELHNGPIPAGMVVCHKCDVPACVNPAHLFIGTQADNVHDSANKGRKKAWGLQKLNADDVLVIRAQAARGLRQKDIAAAFGISHNHVSSIVNRKVWAHLDEPVVVHAPEDRWSWS